MRNILVFSQISFWTRKTTWWKFAQNKRANNSLNCISSSSYKKLKTIPAPCPVLWSHSSKGYNRAVFINLYKCFLTIIQHNYSLSEDIITELTRSQNCRMLCWVRQCHWNKSQKEFLHIPRSKSSEKEESRFSFGISNSLKYSFYDKKVNLALHTVLLAVRIAQYAELTGLEKKPNHPKPNTRNIHIFGQIIFCRH